jgi:hypothetical protein
MRLRNLLYGLWQFTIGVWFVSLFAQSLALLSLVWILASLCFLIFARLAFLGESGNKGRISKTVICLICSLIDCLIAVNLVMGSTYTPLFSFLKAVALIVLFIIFSNDDFDNWTKIRVTKIIKFAGRLIEVPETNKPQFAWCIK